MNNLDIYDRVWQVPEKWDELSPRAFVRVCTLRRSIRYTNLLKLHLTMLLLGVRWWRPRIYGLWWFGIGKLERWAVTQVAEPFVQMGQMQRTMLQRIGRLHVCNADLLNELDAVTWGNADGYFIRWRTTGDVDLLRALVCTLYARKGTPRELRLRGASAKRVNRLPLRILEAVGANWSGMRMVYEKEFPHVFPKEVQARVAEGSSWPDVLRHLGGGVAGWNATSMVPARVVLSAYNEAICEAKNRRHRASKPVRK